MWGTNEVGQRSRTVSRTTIVANIRLLRHFVVDLTDFAGNAGVLYRNHARSERNAPPQWDFEPGRFSPI